MKPNMDFTRMAPLTTTTIRFVSVSATCAKNGVSSMRVVYANVGAETRIGFTETATRLRMHTGKPVKPDLNMAKIKFMEGVGDNGERPGLPVLQRRLHSRNI